MILDVLAVGPFAANCYIVAAADGGSCVVIDPGDECPEIEAALRRRSLSPELVLFTHSHADHIGAAGDLLENYLSAVIACSAGTDRRARDPKLNLSAFLLTPMAAPAAGRILADGETFSAAGLEWTATEIPGHDPGELVYRVGNAVFTGDTVFAGSIGRGDFPGGDAGALVRVVRRYLQAIPAETVLYPGHGPATTAGAELASNPFLM